MKQYASLDTASLQNAWLTIGVFDGVHRGHRALLEQLIRGAHTAGAPAVALTFHPHPAHVLGGRDIPCLTTPAERANLLNQAGLDALIDQPFDRHFSHLTAEEFMAQVKERLGLSVLLIGYDTALGRNRAGNAETLKEIGKTLGYEVKIADIVRAEGQILSSSLIRAHIQAGDVAAAAAALGRHYDLSGPVVPGDGRGRTIGIPTANVDLPPTKALPANGVYAVWAWIAGHPRAAVANLGVRPTFGGTIPRLEVHVLDLAADLYGQELRVEFVARLRGEQKFESIEALVAQIRADGDAARRTLSG